MCGLVSLTLLVFAAIPAHAQNQLWITQFGTSRRDVANGLAPDGAGGVMVAGWTYGSLGGPNAGISDAFLARYDSAGNRLWIRQFGASRGHNFSMALAPDGAAGVFFAGLTEGSLGGPNAGWDDAFLARYDSEGNQLWIRQLGTSGDDWAEALAPDGAGGVMVAGWTAGSLGGPNAGHYDAFLARYNSAGDQLWIRQFGTNMWDVAFALAPDGAGGVMVAGYTYGSLGGPNAGNSDAFLARYDSAGNRLWIRQFGTSSNDEVEALASDEAGSVFVSGNTNGSLGGPNAGNSDVFLARYDQAGNRLWIRQFGTSADDKINALASDGAGGVILAGWTRGSLGGPHAGHYDAFLARYDSAGNRLWIRQFGTSGWDAVNALAPHGTIGMMVAGGTEGSLGGPNAGRSDAFVARYTIDSCYADCDHSTGAGVLDMLDFLCWQEDFMAGNSYACDCDTTTGLLVCDIFDFLCFQNTFVAGCP